MSDDNAAWAEVLFASDVAEDFSERFTEGKDISEVSGSKVRTCAVRSGALAADLNDANDLAVEQNRRADHLLDGFDGRGAEFYAFEDGSVARGGEIVVDFGAAVAGSARRKGRIAGEGNKSYFLQDLWNQKVQMAPAIGNGKDSHFIIPDAEVLGDFFRDGN